MRKFKHLSRKSTIAAGILLVGLIVGAGLYFGKVAPGTSQVASQSRSQSNQNVEFYPANTDHWKKILSTEQYKVLREAATEAPFTGALEHEKRVGTYYSPGCDKPIFRSEQKYDSGTGWPSFWAPTKPDALIERQESGLLDGRTEVLDTCGSHLGHVFDDGPEPTGKRYCMNSVALYFVPDKQEVKE